MEKPKAVIYLRKSTDREDRQQISIETQRQYCERLARDYGFEALIIEDHKSAKDEGRRPWFKRLLSLCKKGGYDFVIAYDPTRISRNTVDSAYFTELINKGHIKGFYSAESRQFFNGTDIFSALMLGISFLMSKADNQMRSSNTKRKMETLFREGKVMAPTPFGYRNVRFFDEYGRIIHDVGVIEEEAKIVRRAFEMRLGGKQFKEIAQYFTKHGYKKSVSTVEQMLKNPFYIGIQRGKLGEAEIRMPWYRPIVSCRLFEQVNSIRRELRGFHSTPYEAPLKGLVFWNEKEPLVAYETKNRYWTPYVYYRAKNHSLRKLNFSQIRLFERFDEYMEWFRFPVRYLEEMEKSLKKAFRFWEESTNEKRLIQNELSEIESSKKILAQKLIAGVVSDEDYRELSIAYLQRKKRLEERLSMLSGEIRDTNTLIMKWVELLGKLLPAYDTKSPQQKADVLKVIQVELFVEGDLSLSIAENKLLKCARELWLSYGSPNRIRTYDPTVNSRLLYHWATEEYTFPKRKARVYYRKSKECQKNFKKFEIIPYFQNFKK